MDPYKIAQKLVEYLILGVAVAVAAYYIPNRNMKLEEVLLIAASAATSFLILDMFVPSIGESARQGAGMGIGFKQVGFGNPLKEGFDSKEDCDCGCDEE